MNKINKIKWKEKIWNGESHTWVLRKTKPKDWETDFPIMPDVQTKMYSWTIECPKRTSPHPQANEIGAWTPAKLLPLCAPCP